MIATIKVNSPKNPKTPSRLEIAYEVSRYFSKNEKTAFWEFLATYGIRRTPNECKELLQTYDDMSFNVDWSAEQRKSDVEIDIWYKEDTATDLVALAKQKHNKVTQKICAAITNGGDGDTFSDGSEQLDLFGIYSIPGIPDIPKLPKGQATFSNSINMDKVENGCKHEFVEYLGFNNSYEYCKKCDVKKENV